MARGRVRGVTGTTREPIERGWEIAYTAPGGERPTSWSPAHVPGTAASALPDRTDYDALDWWWRVPLESARTANRVLGFGGVATLWDAWLDGEHVISCDSMWSAREVPIARGASELVIRCRSVSAELANKRPRPRWKVPMLEQQQLRWIRTTLLGRTPGWSPPWPAVGPWRGVWLEDRPHAVGDVWIDARLDGETGIVELAAAIDVPRAQLRVGEHTGELVQRDGRLRGTCIVPNAARWWPHTHGAPALYSLSIDAGAFAIDLGRTGFRTIDFGGDCTVRVNGVPIFCRGACWTPLDARTLSATPAAYDAAVAQCARAGMNMLRVSGATIYEADAFLDALDAHGVLLWQDLMFANMDYPDELAIGDELAEQAARWQARPSLAVVCGNSEGAQQAAMFGATRDRWAPPLFHETVPRALADLLPRVPYVPSSASGGAFPHASNAGPSSYYGVGAYRRPLEDARRAEVAFASECLGFANIGAELPPDWRDRTPRDRGADWTFDDIRDHYARLLFGEPPPDAARALDLGRWATGEVMARTFAEWRRARSPARGGLVWFLRDLWPGAGWGVIDATGRPKLAWYALRRALAPLAVALTDEGTNGLAIHILNDRGAPTSGELELALWRGDVSVGRGMRALTIEPHGALEIPATDLLDGFSDLSYAYRFGPPIADAIHITFAGADAFWFPAGLTDVRFSDVGLRAELRGEALDVTTAKLARFVTIDLPGYLPDDDGFHLAPGPGRTIALQRTGAPLAPGTIRSLDSAPVPIVHART